ncbi:MAG: hypothetical protein GF313_00635 [Caldithrix sp.]|nr:hypothetical protein [Caldithrix sp.]
MQEDNVKKMKPIWFFVGLMLVVIGGLILIAGIMHVVSPPEVKTVLQDTHPDIWWGSIMIITGIIFLFIKEK